MSNTSIQDRATGALMGAFIGDALALGPHWYYNLTELRQLADKLASQIGGA